MSRADAVKSEYLAARRARLNTLLRVAVGAAKLPSRIKGDVTCKYRNVQNQEWVQTPFVSGSNTDFAFENEVNLQVEQPLLSSMFSRPLRIYVQQKMEVTPQNAGLAAMLEAKEQQISALIEDVDRAECVCDLQSSPSPAPPPPVSAAQPINSINTPSTPASPIASARISPTTLPNNSPTPPNPVVSPVLTLGYVDIDLTPLLVCSSLSGSYPLSSLVLPPPPPSFMPDPDLGGEMLPLKMMQDKDRATTPSTPDREKDRKSAGEKKKSKKEEDQEKEAERLYQLEMDRLSASLPLLISPAQLFISITLSRPLLTSLLPPSSSPSLSLSGPSSPAPSAASTNAASLPPCGSLLRFNLARLTSLPITWLQACRDLEEMQKEAELEAEAAIANWKKKGGKRGGAANKASADKSANKEAKGKSDKNDKRKSHELETKSVQNQLNSHYEFHFQFLLPLSDDVSIPFVATSSTISLPPSPPASPSASTQFDFDVSLVSSPGDSSSPRVSSAGSIPGSGFSTQRKSGGTVANSQSGKQVAQNSNKDKKSKKEEEARIAKELAEQNELLQQSKLLQRYVSFEYSKQIFLTDSSLSYVRSLLAVRPRLPFHVWRSLVTYDPVTSTSSRVRDPLFGVGYVDLRVLSKPGVMELKQEAHVTLDQRVIQHMEDEFNAKQQERAAQLEREETSSPINIPHDAGKRQSLGHKKESKEKKGNKHENVKKEDIPPIFISPPDPFCSNHTCASYHLEMSRPLVPLVLKPKLSLAQVIPPHTEPQLQVDTAGDQFKLEVQKFIQILADEYQALSLALEQNAPSPDEFWNVLNQELLFDINSKGIYHAFKERLKLPIAKLYQQISPSSPSSSLETCYASLIDRMHHAWSELFHAPPPPPSELPSCPFSAPQPHPQSTPCEQSAINNMLELAVTGLEPRKRLGEMARDAELAGDYHRAQSAHFIRCNLNEPHVVLSAAWYDFACFQLRLNRFSEASTCLRRSISYSSDHHSSLLALACLSLERNDLELCEVLLRTLRDMDKHPIMLVIQGIYYQQLDEEQLAQQSWEAASQLWQHFKAADQSPVSNTHTHVSPFQSSTLSVPSVEQLVATSLLSEASLAPHSLLSESIDESLYIRVARYCLSLHFTRLAQIVLSKDESVGPWKSLCMGHLYFLGGYSSYSMANSHLNTCISQSVDEGEVIEALMLQGHMYWEQHRLHSAQAKYERVLEWQTLVVDPLLLYRLARIYESEEQWEQALQAFLQLCANAPSAAAWLGIAHSAIKLNRLSEAEQALVQCNLHDRSNSEVWGFLAWICLSTDRVELANNCAIQAIKLGLKQTQLLTSLGSLYLSKGIARLSVCLLSLCVSVSESSSSSADINSRVDARVALADALTADKQYENAIQQLKAAWTLKQPDQSKHNIETKIQYILEILGRRQEVQDIFNN